MRRWASLMNVSSSSTCLVTSSRWWKRASISSGSESELARLKAVTLLSACVSSPRISASFWVMMSRVRVTWPARTWRLPSMYSSANRFAARAAVSGLRLRTVMENALSPSAWTSASLIIWLMSSLPSAVPPEITIDCSLPVPRSLADTCTMPFASISNVTSICGTLRGAGGKPVSVNVPNCLLR